MNDILVYLTDAQFEDEIRQTLTGRNYVSYLAQNPEELIEICKREFIDLILIWPADKELTGDILNLLRINNLGQIPVVPAVQKNGDLADVLNFPVISALQFPLPRLEFLAIIDRLFSSLGRKSELISGKLWQGQLREFAPIELIQMIRSAKKDALLKISLAEATASIFFKEGKIIKADLRDLKTNEVLKKILPLKAGDFQLQYTRIDAKSMIELSKDVDIDDLKSGLAEQEKFLEQIPDPEENLVKAGVVEAEQSDAEKELILAECEQGRNLFEILISLDLENTIILKKTIELREKGLLVRLQDLDLIQQNKQSDRGLAKLFNSIKSVFKKEKEMEIVLPPVPSEPVSEQQIQPKIRHEFQPPSGAAIQKIQKYLEEVKSNANS